MDESTIQTPEAPTTQGVPEDHELANGLVYDMDHFQQLVEPNRKHSRYEAAGGEDGARKQKQLADQCSTLGELSPTIIALARRLEQIRSAELERNRRRLGVLEPFQHRAIEALTLGILNKILHGPVSELQAHAGAPERHVLAQLVRRLFGVA
jgi:glutamyl-tRNA reductase